MKQPSKELVDAFLAWYRNDPHAQNEDHYVGQISREILGGLSREQFIEFFFQFARDGGFVQSGGYRTAPRFRASIKAKYDEFRALVLEPFADGFDEMKWLDRIEEFSGLGQGLAILIKSRN